MAIDLGSANTTRYHSVPDHADFTLPNGDWAWIALCYPQSSADIKYIISTGAFGAAGSFNLLCYNTGGGGFSVKVDTLPELILSDTVTVDSWYLAYATRRGGFLFSGSVPLNNIAGAKESTGQAISASYNSATGLNIGRRTDGTANRHWKGRWGQTAFISGAGLTASRAVELASGASLLGMFGSNVKFLLHGSSASSATIADLISGHVATRQGSTYGTNEEDAQAPYIWTPDYIRGVASLGGTTYNQSLAGSLTPAGAITKSTLKVNGGFLSMSGGLVKKTYKTYAGSMTAAGAVAKRTTKAFGGSITGSGALGTMILFTASLAGSLTPAGALSKLTMKALAGSSTLAGAITKMTFRTLDGNISLVGVVTKLTKKAFAGSVTVTGALMEQYSVLKALAGTITPAGALATVYTAFVAGILKLLALMGVGQ